MCAERAAAGERPLSVLVAGQEQPDRAALIADGGVAVSWGQLAGETAALLDRWSRGGGLLSPPPAPGPGPVVALVGAGDRATVTVVLALIEAGAPFELLHPRSTAAEERALVADSGSVRFWSPAEVRAMAEEATAGPRPLGHRRPAYDRDGRRTLAVLHTSGTSGRPKGAVLTRAAMDAAVRASEANLGWREEDRWLLSLPLAHVGGLSIVLRCLAGRRAMVLQPPGPFRAADLRRRVEEQRVTLLSLVPTMLSRCLDLEPPWIRPAPLRAVLVGGAATPQRLFERARAAHWPVLTTYGMTEACSQIATQRYLDLEGDLDAGGTEAGPGVGPPVERLELRIATPDERGVGEIEIRGPGLFDGYWSEGRLERPFDAEGWFATGDHGWLDAAGELHVVGRRQDLVVSGGENVYPAEVERVLESHPGIAAAAVVGVPDEEWGEQVAAALVPVAEPLAVEELRAFLAPRLASFKHPRRLLWLDRLPVSDGGKLDRGVLRARFAAGAAEREDPGMERSDG